MAYFPKNPRSELTLRNCVGVGVFETGGMFQLARQPVQRLRSSTINCGVTGIEISWVDGNRVTRPSGGSVLSRSSQSGTGGAPCSMFEATILREWSRFLTWI